MKKLQTILIALSIAAMPALALASTAELQIIHNAADPAAAEVDVYVNGEPALNNFAFREATPFLELPAGVELKIDVAPGTSLSVDESLATFKVTLRPGGRYLAVANGVLEPEDFAPNPDGRSTGFTLFLADRMKSSGWRGTVSLRAVHGASDAPAVDIRARKDGKNWSRTLYGGVAYGDIGKTRGLVAKDWLIDVTLPGKPDAVVATYKAPLSGLKGQAIVVFASGFLDPATNQDGAGFGLFAALDDGTVIALPLDVPTARLQIIHNAADPAAAEVDVWVNGERSLNNFAFREATPFLELPAGVDLIVGIAPGDSDEPDDALAEFTLNLMDGGTYVAMATGVLDPAEFAPNPDFRNIGFNVQPLAGAREEGPGRRIAVVAFHGATDAPKVDILKKKSGSWKRSYPLVRGLGYGEFSAYGYLQPMSYELQVTPAGDPMTVVAAYTADLSGLGGGATVVFASGFLDPLANQDGMAFGLFAALPDGTVLPLPAADMEDPDKAAALAALPSELEQNYPNPFNPTTTIAFSVPSEGRISLKVYDMRGRLVRDLVNEVRGAGRHEITFDASRLASGMYLYRIEANGYSDTKRMTLLK